MSFEHNVFEATRTIYLGGEVDASCARDIIQGLHVLGSKNRKIPITLLINSAGGDVDDGWAIYDAIKCSVVPVVGIVLGTCQSSAMTILQACHKRLVSPNSTLMIHDGTVSLSRTHMSEAVEVGKQLTRDLDRLYKMISETTGLHPKKVKALCRYSTFFNAEQAVALHLADSVLQPPQRKSHGRTIRRSKRAK